MRYPGKNCTPANAVSFQENRYFLLHRPRMYGGSEILCVDRMRYLKNFVSLQTLFPESALYLNNFDHGSKLLR